MVTSLDERNEGSLKPKKARSDSLLTIISVVSCLKCKKCFDFCYRKFHRETYENVTREKNV